ncbi:type II CRISPR RNA-guided endonuclease Cas9 [Planctomicrobium piriforme]|uniref:CRISPR-associated endonuclease Cas9 n=1 Tax=Planctomicrobium piriforme TaxID=1576369 RepID=A0A1I3B7H6_9PLAN|nr:type II CRISPR RNA-guided endonuclease Cas9 [Planctomicrobium piriforme]SFH58228.1 CRISPR-associated endonuclease Csn1 [Planctomicrobium piriforme]
MVNAIPYRLGLDLGASSLGWAVIQLDQPGGQPNGILAAGVRIFEAGVEGDIEQGKDASRAVVRREARQPRRQQWRRQRRKQKLFILLQQLGLLPPSETNDSAARKSLLDQLDAQLTEKYVPAGDHDKRQKLPYQLRDMASTGPVEAFELGRALYHLAQRRGYLSNRKGQSKDEDAGQVLSAISTMDEKLQQSKLKLGAYFNRKVNPHEERIRRRWLGRKQYRDEFAAIRTAQAGAHSQLTKDVWDKIDDAIFFQRPLKSQSHLIGRCELEFDKRKKGLKRSPLALPISQEFRILQKVNDLRVKTPTRNNEPLNEKERQTLFAVLNEAGEISWSKVKTLLKLPKAAKFSLEEWDDKLIGNRTNSKMTPVFGPRWLEMPLEERTAIAQEVLHYRKPEALQKRAMKAWGLDEAAAYQLAFKTHLEPDYASHSRKAMEKLIEGEPGVEGLKAGASYSTVRKALYPERFTPGKMLAALPPVNQWKADIRNPAVIRALTELRKVVNALMKKYGKPEHIHIELARDIRNSRQKRKDIFKQNQENQKRRLKAVEGIVKEGGLSNPKRRDIEKWLLAEECNRECPYCGKTINMRKLMGDDAEFNVEHIYPRRYLDDSFLNKTIACRKCNDTKGDQTPATAFHGDYYEQILQRVERFQGTAREVKLLRFKTEIPPADFTDRQLNDTRYNSRLAAEYLQLLYGGRFDSSGEQRILSPTGQLTGKVRAVWQLNDLLGEEDGQKERQDHRHHAIDAVVIALMTQKQIQRLSQIAGDSEKHHARHFFESIQWPWTNFKNDVAYAVEAINVSHRPTHAIAGPLHAETIYSKNFGTEKKPEHRVRKHISKLTAKEISGDQIVDPHVRTAVQKTWEAKGKPLPAKLWGTEAGNEENFPRLIGQKDSNGGSIIRKVRLKTDAKPRGVGKGVRERNYASGKDSNYASLIYAIVDKDGNEIKWEHEILDRLSAHRLLSANHGKPGEKVLLPNGSEKRKFKFALRKNDMLLAQGPDGQDVLYRVQKFSQDEIQLCEHSLSTVTNETRTPWNRIRSAETLRKFGTHRVVVTLTGEMGAHSEK